MRKSFQNNLVKFPATMADIYKISPSLPVPAHIIRPPYVGMKKQEFPSLDGPIHVMNAD